MLTSKPVQLLFTLSKVKPTKALELIKAAVAQDPFLPVYCIEERGVALFALRRFEEALSALGAMPFQTFRSRCYEAACRVSMDDQAGARKAVSKVLQIYPTLTALEFCHKETYQDRKQISHLRDLLLAAGLPK